MHNNPVDVGVRVEVPKAVMDSLTDVLYEAKLEYFSKSFDDRLRTFCMCPGGEVTMENTGGADPVVYRQRPQLCRPGYRKHQFRHPGQH